MATNLIAAEMGIDIHRFLKNEPDELKETRELLNPIQKRSPITIEKEKRQDKEELITVSKKIVNSFGLPSNLSKDANRMAEIYPSMYVLENLLRFVIIKVLSEVFTQNWWNNPEVTPTEVKNEVEKRMYKEGVNRWHYKRGSHGIFYTNFGDLVSIISKNWKQFSPLFNKLNWVQTKLEEVELSRNIIAHNNPLPQREFDRIKMCLEDMQKQLEVYLSKNQ